MRLLTVPIFLLISLNLSGQSSQSLVTYLSFDKNGCAVEDEAGDPAIQIFAPGDSICGCGVQANSRFFDGDDDWFYLFGQRVEETFSTIDFSLSFYFKPTSTSAANQVLFSKKTDCASDRAFSVRFNPATRTLSVELRESNTILGSLSRTLPASCWHHVIVIRKGAMTILYANNQKLGEASAPGSLRVNISNSEPLTIGSGNCATDQDFVGFMDEIRLYSRALPLNDIEDLYLAPNQIATGLKPDGSNDTTIYLGGAVPIQLTTNCANTFDWTPAADVASPDQGEPVITPSATTTYTVEMIDQEGCRSNDSIRIVVVDPTTVECGDILLPTAFTPNGDGLNDRYGISNPFVTGVLLAFDIYDRWGNLVFTTTDAFGKWDGNYKGQPVNPGVFLYKIHYSCEGTENVKSGSVTVIR